MTLKELAYFLIIVLMLLQLGKPCYSIGYGARNRVGSVSPMGSLKVQNGVKESRSNNKDEDDDIFGADKRKVYTGANPLHNR